MGKGCGKSHFERIKPHKTNFRGTLAATASVPDVVEITETELYSSYLGKVPIRAKVVGENVYLESIYQTVNNKKIYIKVIDMVENDLDDDYVYPPQQLLKLTSVCINRKENIYKYLLTLYCYLRINQLEFNDENIERYKKLIENVKNEELIEKIKLEYPKILEDDIQLPLSSIKKILHSVTIYNSRIDILFASLEYLEFISVMTNGKIDTINDQDILICISGVPNLDNAYWNGKYMVFGNGDLMFYPLTSIDVIGHELTHGLVQGVCDLEYKGHSGALNESYADIFGTMLEFYVYEKYNDRILGKGDWLIGEDLTIDSGCLRNMADPNSSDQPAKMFDKYYVDPNSMIDYGGVHINSGIPNHCFYLASQQVDKFISLKVFIECLFKLVRKSDFYLFSNTLSSISSDKYIIDSLATVGLSPKCSKRDRHKPSHIPPTPSSPSSDSSSSNTHTLPPHTPPQYPYPFPQYPYPFPQYPFPQYPYPPSQYQYPPSQYQYPPPQYPYPPSQYQYPPSQYQYPPPQYIVPSPPQYNQHPRKHIYTTYG